MASVKKDKIVAGIIEYVEEEVFPEIASDKGFRAVLSIGIGIAKKDGSVLDKLLENEYFKALSGYDPESETYSTEDLISALKHTAEECGYIPINIPSIPLISPNEKTLKFSAGDVEKLKKYIT